MSANGNLLEILTLLSEKGGLSGKYLEEHLGVDRRTVRNYIAALNDAGFTVTASRGKYSQYRLQGGHPLAGLQLTENEIEALNAAKDMLRIERGYAYEETFLQMLDKVKNHARQLVDSAQVPVADNTPGDPMRVRSQMWLQMIRSAIHENRKLKMTYHTAGRNATTERIVWPYGLYNADDENYLLAYCEAKDGTREFNVKRVLDMTVLKDRYPKSNRISVKDYFQHSIGAFGGETFNVKLLIRPPFSQTVLEKKLVKNQKTKTMGDGSIQFEARLSGRPDVVRWILGMGEHCTVLEPDNLKTEVAEVAARVGMLYQ